MAVSTVMDIGTGERERLRRREINRDIRGRVFNQRSLKRSITEVYKIKCLTMI